MSLPESAAPVATLVLHAEKRGLLGGAGLAAVLAVPALLVKPALAAPNAPFPLAVSRFAGAGAIAGAGVCAVLAGVKISKLDKAGIDERADKIKCNETEKRLDAVVLAGAALGVAVGVGSTLKDAKGAGVPARDVVANKEFAWDVFCVAALGSACAVGLLKAGELAVKGFNKLKENGAEVPSAAEITEAAENAASAAKDSAADAVSAAQDAAAGAGDAAQAAADATADAVKDAAGAAKDAAGAAKDAADSAKDDVSAQMPQ